MRWRIVLPALTLALVAAVLVIPRLAPSEVQWRLDVLAMKARGGLPDIGWAQLVRMLKPGSGFYLASLAQTGNPYASIANPFTSSEDVAAGSDIFAARCATCHGSDAEGVSGPALASGRFASGDSDWALYKTIDAGVAGTAMVAQGLEDRAIWQVIAHLRAVASLHEARADAAGDRRLALRPVSARRLLEAQNEPANWLMFSGNYRGDRHSRLDSIGLDTVSGLRVVWARQLQMPDSFLEASPLAVDGKLFLTAPPNQVLALDGATGRPLWRYTRALPRDLSLCCGDVNRGVAILDDRLYLATLDAHLVALEAATGRVIWDVETAPHAQGFSATAAPLAVGNRIVTGVAGGEFGIRGFLDAYDPQTGERLWRFETIPGPGEPGADTWSGDSWKQGGGPTWMTGSYDPELDLLYWGVGNPSPDFMGDNRLGDNLYTNSVVALDPETGALRWHFQFTPHDEHDWDANQVPVLVDADYAGQWRKLMLTATKNGFYYVLDRETGQFLGASAFAHQTWAERIDATGRPVRTPNSAPSAKGTLVYPGAAGATNWWPPAYSPATGLVYVPTLEMGNVFFKSESVFTGGELYMGSTTSYVPGEPYSTWLKALDGPTGEIAWKFRGPQREAWGRSGGTLVTAGGIVFWGDDTTFFALNAQTGEELWRFETGGRILAAPITYEIDGRQRVTLLAGNVVFTFGLD